MTVGRLLTRCTVTKRDTTATNAQAVVKNLTCSVWPATRISRGRLAYKKNSTERDHAGAFQESAAGGYQACIAVGTSSRPATNVEVEGSWRMAYLATKNGAASPRP